MASWQKRGGGSCMAALARIFGYEGDDGVEPGHERLVRLKQLKDPFRREIQGTSTRCSVKTYNQPVVLLSLFFSPQHQ